MQPTMKRQYHRQNMGITPTVHRLLCPMIRSELRAAGVSYTETGGF